MNCKPGDLAVIVRSYKGHEGKIITCLKLHPAGTDDFPKSDGRIWETDTLLEGSINGLTPYFPDSQLRPIRDNPGQDETLQWRDVPTKETA